MGATPQIATKPYDFSNVVITFGGTTMLGLKSVKVTRDSPATTDEVGANGDVVVTVSNDERGSVELEFMPSSPTLDFMSQQLALFRATKQFKALEVADLNGTSKARGLECWIEKVADAEYGAESTSRTFKIRVARISSFIGALS